MDADECKAWSEGIKTISDRIGPWEDVEASLFFGLAAGLAGSDEGLDSYADIGRVMGLTYTADKGENAPADTLFFEQLLADDQEAQDGVSRAWIHMTSIAAVAYARGYWDRRAGLPAEPPAVDTAWDGEPEVDPTTCYTMGYEAGNEYVIREDMHIPVMTAEQQAAGYAQYARWAKLS